MPTIRSIVRESVVTARPETSVDDLASAMADESVGSVVISDDEGQHGIVTDRDIALEVVAESHNPSERTAADVMSTELITVDHDSGIFEVLRTMEAENVRRIPAVDDDGTLAGIVSFDDFVILLARELRLLANVVEAEIPPYEHT